MCSHANFWKVICKSQSPGPFLNRMATWLLGGTWDLEILSPLTFSAQPGTCPCSSPGCRAAVETSHLDSHHPPLLRLLWQGWCGLQPLPRGQHVSSKIYPSGPWAHPSGLPASLWVQFKVAELLSKV